MNTASNKSVDQAATEPSSTLASYGWLSASFLFYD